MGPGGNGGGPKDFDDFLGETDLRFGGGGSLSAICLRMLTLFSDGARAKAFFKDEGSSKLALALDLGFSGGNSGGHSGDGGLSCFFLIRPDDD